mmetsp:Transcript_39466/g.92200  ORF Transcript_39466/g.92200 Transcript_39466/m.92200 type:complete len:180 (+) Transcript_39466:74-613(+)
MTEAVRTSHRRPLPSTCTALTHKEKPTTSFFIFQGPCCFWKNALPAMTETAGTFHRRPLPSTCTALTSKEGRNRFNSALAQNCLKSFFPLIEQFTTQSEPAYCGISTLVIVLNALSVDPLRVWKGSWRWYNESMLNCCVDLNEVRNFVTSEIQGCFAFSSRRIAIDRGILSRSKARASP